MKITRRSALPEDFEFLLELYATTRAAELALVPWTNEQKAVFVRTQFEAKQNHYQTRFPTASFEVILLDGEKIGRLDVLRADDQIRILDLMLDSRQRGRGIGGQLIASLIEEATTALKPLRIYLESISPYFPFFERRNFYPLRTDDGFYILLEHPHSAS